MIELSRNKSMPNKNLGFTLFNKLITYLMKNKIKNANSLGFFNKDNLFKSK